MFEQMFGHLRACANAAQAAESPKSRRNPTLATLVIFALDPLIRTVPASIRSLNETLARTSRCWGTRLAQIPAARHDTEAARLTHKFPVARRRNDIPRLITTD